MKKILLPFLFLLVIAITSAQTTITQLPFGCKILVTHHFADSSKIHAYPDEEDTVKGPDEKAFEAIIDYNNKISMGKVIHAVHPAHVEYLKIPEPFNWHFDLRLNHNIDSIRYRLPDFGPYQCYYAYTWDDTASHADLLNHCLTTGNLILYNPKTNSAKVLNISFSASGDYVDLERQFYIDKNKTIYLYEFPSDEVQMRVKKVATIRVMEDGEVRVE